MTSKTDQNAKVHYLFTIIDEMLRVKSCFETLFAEIQSASELSTLQKLVLSCVLDRTAPPTVPQIGRELGNPRQVIQRIVNELSEQGLVEKVENPRHRRASLLKPTAKAIAMRDQAERRAVEAARDMLGGISIEHCEALAEELRTLRQVLESAGPRLAPDALLPQIPVSVSRALATL